MDRERRGSLSSFVRQLTSGLHKYGSLYSDIVKMLLLNLPLIFLAVKANIDLSTWFSLTGVYVVGVAAGYYALIALAAVTVVFLLLFAVRKAAMVGVGAVLTIALYYLILDSLTFRIARTHIDLFWLEWIWNDISGFGLPSSTFIYAAVLLLVVIGLELSIFFAVRRIPWPRFSSIGTLLLIVVAFAVSQTIHVVAYDSSQNRITSLSPYFPFYYPITSHSNAETLGEYLALNDDDYDDPDPSDSAVSMTYPLATPVFDNVAVGRSPNIIIILLESWRFDSLNDSVTPNIHALARRSTVFDNHFSSGNQTTCGVFGMFYGLPASYWSTVKANASMIDKPVLIDVLEERGYSFGIYARSNFERHRISDAIFRGIDIHESFAGKSVVERDADMTRQVTEFIRRQSAANQPYMSLVFYKSNHSPYNYPESHRVFTPAYDLNPILADKDSDPQPFINDYWNATHYVDSLVGEIVNTIDSLGQFYNTVVLVTTDHGESFNDNHANYWGHGSNYTRYQVQVPLVYRAPGRPAGEITYATSHTDIPITLLQDQFGYSSDPRVVGTGRNLFEPSPSPRTFVIGSYVNHAIVTEQDVYEIYPVYTRKYKLADINTPASTPDRSMMAHTLDNMTRFTLATSAQFVSHPHPLKQHDTTATASRPKVDRAVNRMQATLDDE